MKDLKKVLALVLIAVLTVGVLTACGGKKDAPADDAGDTEAAHYVISTDKGFSPFEFEDEDGNIVGIDMDILAAVAEDQGFTYDLHYIGWDAAIAECRAGQADGMIAGASLTDERKESGWIFSDGYYDATQGMAVKSDSDIASLDDLKGKTVAVVGGGDAAIDDANYLADIAEKVYLIHRRDEFTAEKSDLEVLKSRSNVEFVLNANVKSLNGTDRLESIDVLFNDESTKNISVDGIFIAVGQEPKNEMFSNVVDLNEFGYIISEDGVHTKTKGIYVAGDNRIKLLRQLTTAVSDGSVAATVAIKEFNEL